jgi:hypothetical protein
VPTASDHHDIEIGGSFSPVRHRHPAPFILFQGVVTLTEG